MQAGGHRFDPVHLHQEPSNIFNCCLIKLTKPSHREFLSRTEKKLISVHMIIQAIKVQLVDALASRGDEGRDTLR